MFYDADPLWDGQGCVQLIGCYTFNKPPWFFTKLDQHTSDDIELRAVCADEATDNEDDLDN